MTEKEILEKIKLSAEEIKAPEGISPEMVKMRLDAEKKRHRKNTGNYKKTMVAAAILLVCGISVAGAVKLRFAGSGGSAADGTAGMTAQDDGRTAGSSAVSSADGSTPEKETAAERTPKADAGELYVVADNYEEVYRLLDQNSYRKQEEMMEGAVAGGEIMESAGASDVSLDSAASTPYSQTNVQTEGVDESDTIKTDGSYLYIVDEDAVKMIDIRGEKMKEAGEIKIPVEGAADRVIEIYVDGDILNVILEKEDTGLKNGQSGPSGDNDFEICEDVFYLESNTRTQLLTYDIESRSNPVLKGSITQDGSYKTSRKVGDVIYLFTEKYMEVPELPEGQAVDGENLEKWIPIVNGKPVGADSIYLSGQGTNGLLIASVDVEKPDAVVDNTLILNDYVEIYVGESAMYLYHTDYRQESLTQVAKFAFADGVINAVGAVSVPGEVYDSFAIHEYQGSLRLLTTNWSDGQPENGLYLFDETLKLTGSLTGIAAGEQIYAARYLGDMAYFVTYRNTDPLFAVDLSDAKNPQILSELKITGFSEYLHFWGEDQLVGIGFETDPDTGERKGIKLSMFDISDPAELKTLGTKVLTGFDHSPAMFSYKSVLADTEENLIGFSVVNYDGGMSGYLLFAWENGEFRRLLSVELPESANADHCRGIYAGNRFYVVSEGAAVAYGRDAGYEEKERLEW